MAPQGERPTGLTKDAGYQIGARRTLPVGHQDAWAILTSVDGLAVWLGPVARMDWAKGATYQLPDGSQGQVRVFRPDSHLRISWQPVGWERASIIQMRVIPRGDRTTIAFHQEHLPGQREREERRAHFQSALDQLERMIGGRA